MKRICKQVLSAVLALTMLMALTVNAAAAEKTVKHFNNYCSFGDSVAVAWGYDSQPGTFPKLVAEAVQAEDPYFFHVNGLRAKDLYIALGGLYPDLTAAEIDEKEPVLPLTRFRTACLVEGRREENNPAHVKAADLITICTGSCDVFYYAQSMSGIADALLDPASVDMTAVIENYIALLWEGYNSFCEYLPLVIQKIQELKAGTEGEYTVVLVGTYNPVAQLRISDEIDTPIGNAALLVSEAMNKKYQEIAAEYGCLYADIANVETGAMESGQSVAGGAVSDEVSASYSTHPSYPDGYAYIARQIIELLTEEVQPLPKTFIQVDLGSMDNVKTVTLGTRTLKPGEYFLDGHVLTVMNYSTSAKLLTVTTERADGNTGTQTYALSYDCEDGYTARMIYQTVDLVKSIRTVAANIRTVAKTVFDAIANLFKK